MARQPATCGSGNQVANLDNWVDVEIGHRSISVAHLGVISVRMNQSLKWNPDREIFTGANAAEANKWLAREQRKPYDYSFIA